MYYAPDYYLCKKKKNGKVWATIPQMKQLAAEYGLEASPVVAKLQTLLEKIAGEATQDEAW